MGSSLVLLYNTWSFIIDLFYNYLYLYDLSSSVSNIDFMISYLCYYMFCMIRHLALVHLYPFQYLKVCSSMMSVHPTGGASTRDLEYRLLM